MMEAYSGSKTLAEAHAKVVSFLFGSYGLIILDPDSASLKAQFSPYLLKELVEQSSTPAMQEAEKTLLDANYSAQVFGRPINLFYLENGRRERIIPTGEDTFEVLNTDLKFNDATIKQLVQEHPEKLSPNVVLRPLYQEVILPNLAYLGGPAEVSYWLQLKPVFDLWEVPMPVILPRNFALIVNGALQKKLDKIGIGAEELLDEFAEVKKKWLNQQAGEQLNFTIEKYQLTQLFNTLSDKTKAIDGSLVGWLEAERSKSEKQLENIEKD